MALTSANIVIGSGELYITELTSSMSSIPTDATLEVEANRLGHVKDGATVTYNPTYYEAKDDMGLVAKKVLTEEEVIFKSGLMTWVPATLQKMSATGTATSATKTETLELGGLTHAALKTYVLRFVQKEGNTERRVTMVAAPNAGFEFAFKPGEATVIDAEFKAQPMAFTGKEGRLLVYEEKDVSV